MATVSPNSTYVNKDLYNKFTDDVIYNILGGLSLSSTFAINIEDTANLSSASDVSFLAYEAALPGTSFQTTDVFGDRMGISETFANRRTFSPVDISFYVQSSYKTINYFDDWVNRISSTNGSGELNSDSYFKFNYPSSYKKTVKIIKYERDLRSPEERLKKMGALDDPYTITYFLIDAYPTNISAIPVSYEQSSILKMTVTFNYTRYKLTGNARKKA